MPPRTKRAPECDSKAQSLYKTLKLTKRAWAAITWGFHKCLHLCCFVTVIVAGPWPPRWAGVTKVIKGATTANHTMSWGEYQVIPGPMLLVSQFHTTWISAIANETNPETSQYWGWHSQRKDQKVSLELQENTEAILKCHLHKWRNKTSFKWAFLCLCEHARCSLPPGWSLNYSIVVSFAFLLDTDETIITRGGFSFQGSCAESTFFHVDRFSADLSSKLWLRSLHDGFMVVDLIIFLV